MLMRYGHQLREVPLDREAARAWDRLLAGGPCAFGGCHEPGARTVRRWRLCDLHATRLEAAS
ncbi:MAG TPA: hypothetical protein VEW95_09220 [Candidatus Limnocylindrales bacterium]|nr:hypothetical protein [Candidatus Limnocylindrales bacterium]